jgi:hypothetical protein
LTSIGTITVLFSNLVQRLVSFKLFAKGGKGSQMTPKTRDHSAIIRSFFEVTNGHNSSLNASKRPIPSTHFNTRKKDFVCKTKDDA